MLDVLVQTKRDRRAVQRQIEQIETCQADGSQAILIGVVSSGDPELLTAMDMARVPVFGFVNETASPSLNGFVGVDWRDMERIIGLHIAERHPAGTAERTAVLVTGPIEAGWTAPLEIGLRSGLATSAVTLTDVFHADTGVSEQLVEVENALQEFGDADYLIGSAPAIEAAMGLKATGVALDMPILIATYASHSVLRGVSGGQVQAVAFDDPQAQGRMAIRLVARALGGGPDETAESPTIELLTQSSRNRALFRLSPPAFFPIDE